MKYPGDIKVYRIQGVDWYQGQLLYPDWGKALELLSDFEDYFKGETQTFAEVAKKIYEAGLAPKLFALILNPYLPDWKARLKYRVLRLLGKVDRENLTRTLSLQAVFRVIADFFFINTEWIGNLMSSPNESDTRALTMIQGILGMGGLPLMRSSSSSPRETSAALTPQSDSSPAGLQ